MNNFKVGDRVVLKTDKAIFKAGETGTITKIETSNKKQLCTLDNIDWVYVCMDGYGYSYPLPFFPTEVFSDVLSRAETTPTKGE